jgi:hypothetical protein
MSTTDDLLGLAIDKNPVDFADTFNQLMMNKAQERIEQHRIDLAQAIYGENEDPDDSDDVGEDEFDEDDTDTDADLDDDDLDFDLDDLDLDDIDLEDLTDDEDA